MMIVVFFFFFFFNFIFCFPYLVNVLRLVGALVVMLKN